MPKTPQRTRARLSALLKQARAREGLSQVALEQKMAAAMGVESIASTTISRYERGDVTPPLETLDVLCEVLTGREDALGDALADALERLPAPPARKRKESP